MVLTPARGDPFVGHARFTEGVVEREIANGSGHLNWPATVDLVLQAPFLSDADKEAILGGNLMKLVRIGREG